MAKLAAPKGCIVHAIEIDSKGAEVRYRCAGDLGQKEYRYRDRTGAEIIGNYPPPRFFRGVRAIRFRGVTVSGRGAHMGFVLSPAHAICHKSGSEITCRLKGDTSGLGSLRRRRRRRR